MRRTVMRPHCICLSENDLRDFLSAKSRHPIIAHPVRGHWRKLISERFVNKKGQLVFVKQHFRGCAAFDDIEGWRYNVMVKEGPERVREYV